MAIPLKILLSDIINFNDSFDNFDIAGIACDSRKIQKGYMFICLSEHSKQFIPEAIRNGASIIITDSCEDQKNAYNNDVPILVHKSPKHIYHLLSARFYNFAQPNYVAAVTGTNGKTSTVDFCRQIWNNLQYNAASIGTLGTYLNNDLIVKNCLTTPESFELHAILAELYKKNVQYLCLEASSHGIDQYRLHSVQLNCAAFTNISQDHLDYHQNITQYFNVKKKLFTDILKQNKDMVINADIPEYDELFTIAQKLRSNLITYSIKAGKGDLSFIEYIDNTFIKIKVFDKIYDINFPILGEFQISNLLCAIGIIISSGADYKTLPLFGLRPPSGRMEKINDFIIIDYAHTPDALEKNLLSVVNNIKKNIVLVFGCGGERDQYKRPLMGKIAQKYAHKIIITDDNPRYENPAKIRSEILLGCPNAIEIADRKQAIIYAIQYALKNNYIVIIAGKGHEKTQIIGDTEIECDDSLVVSRFLSSFQI